MRITRIRLRNFQCFGDQGTVVPLGDLTAFIGANGTGKTAILQALCRMFGVNSNSRRLDPLDFHVPVGQKLHSQETRELAIEVRIEFPELEDDGAADASIPEAFNQMLVDEPGGKPYCRMRLEGKWTQTGVETGDVSEQLLWILSPNDEGEVDKKAVEPRDRARIKVHYVPANRDTARQLANISGTLLHQLLSAVNWDADKIKNVKEAASGICEQLDAVGAIQRINEENKANWGELYDEKLYDTPSLRFSPTELDDLLKQAQVMFGPTRESAEHDTSRLSDGQRSLFYFAFMRTLCRISRDVYTAGRTERPEGDTSDRITDHIDYSRLRPASLTVLAVEEPENHLSPHYLGRVVSQLYDLAEEDCAQLLLSSHSASVVSRIEPTDLRYLRMDHQKGISEAKSITLPAGDAEAEKYVRQAVRTFPELYFARAVVLCEDDSEEIVLPRLASAYGKPLDNALVAVVPLGGRHVNHLWRLLRDLHIPHVTLLDLDREREGGGWSSAKRHGLFP